MIHCPRGILSNQHPYRK